MADDKLTKPQERVLRRVVKTSGGGVSVGLDQDSAVIMRLHAKGLVQGKLGNPARAVHTREGLDLIRKLDAVLSQESPNV